MKSYTIAKGIVKALAFFFIIALLLFVIYQTRSLIIYITIATVLALLGRPSVIFLRKKFHIGKTHAALITIIIILALIAGFVALFIPMLTEQSKNLALYDFDSIQGELDKIYDRISEYFGTSKQAVEEVVKGSEVEKSVTGEMEKQAVPTLLDTVLGLLTELSVGLFSVIFMAFFMLKDPNSFQRFFLAMVPPSHRTRAIRSLDKTNSLLSRYFLGLLLQISILFVIYVITLFFVGTENALIVAFFCAMFNIVPYVGPLIGALLMALLTVTSHAEMNFSSEVLPLVGYVLIGVTVGQLIDNFVSQPYIYSNSVKSHPMEIFIIIIAAGLMFGIVGMMIAVPTYAVIKVIAKEFFWNNGFVRAWTKGI